VPEIETKKEDIQQKPLIKIEAVNVTYNAGKSNEVRALENVNLEIYPQEFVVILGPSGCGKSTLLYAVSGLQKTTSGNIKIDDECISAYSKKQIARFHQTKIGMIFQSFYLINSLNILDNVYLPKIFERKGGEIKEMQDRAKTLLERFNISEQVEKFPSELSGGQKQRVSVARALMNNPEIILADEPVGNLDSKSAHNVLSILKELNETDKKTIVLVTHDATHSEYADKIVHMKDGKIIKIEIGVKNKVPVESYIFKDGVLKRQLVEQGMVKEEVIPDDLKLLMRSFSNLSFSQIGAMMVPFKTQQLFSHIFFSMTNEQMDSAKKYLQNFLYTSLDFEQLERHLDMGIEKGGAGWDKRYVRTFMDNLQRIVTQAKKINFSDLDSSAYETALYLNDLYELSLGQDNLKAFTGIILDRLKNRIGIDEIQKLFDIQKEKGGLGFDRRTARKIAREIEILILMRYSA
jgi:putative ABC transport system ATP-binding protein